MLAKVSTKGIENVTIFVCVYTKVTTPTWQKLKVRMKNMPSLSPSEGYSHFLEMASGDNDVCKWILDICWILAVFQPTRPTSKEDSPA